RIGTLANTPDVARIRADETLRRDLVAYLRGNVDAIDEGVHALPERFQATRALSYSTFGSARLGNRPFAEILTPEDLAGLDLGRLRLARTPRALVERLDNGTCQGCHQAGSTAGFHLLGLDRPDASRHNRLALGVSPHMQAEVARRASYVAALARGAEPSRFRPLSLAPAADWSGPRPAYRPAGTGAACLGEQARALVGEGWDCGREETCEMVARNPRLGVEYGQCMPKREVTGIACQSGRVATGATPTADRMVLLRRLNSTAERASPTAYTCRPPRIGVPGGLAYRQCSDADRAFTAFQRAGDGPMPAEICALAGGRTFDRCVASGDAPSCLADSVQRGMRPACGRDRGCREDFVCQALPDDLPHRERAGEGVGYCSPTYFVFQMRLDGHPAP
ncbi:MAG TPA: hypothetical protein VEA41_19540, partial [Salinarimonas sp.]|nr:hypothetical protein [Salinarimonas sp.]